MANKTNPWLNGVGIITDPQAGMQPCPASSPSTTSKTAWTIFIVAAVAVCTMLVLAGTPDSMAWDGIRVLGIGVVILFSMAALYRSPEDRLKTAFVVWGLILISECIFFRDEGGGSIHANVAAFEGKFPTSAYSEAVSWILSFGTLLALVVPVRHRLGKLFAGDYKWPIFFALVVAASCLYAPRPGFALAWAFKIWLVTLILLLCAIQINSLKDTVTFLCFTIFAYSVVVLQPVYLGLTTDALFDEEGRMSTIVNPDALSADAAAVFVLALTLYSRVKGEGLRKASLILGIASFVVMILAGGKAGILSGLFAGALFFFIRKGVGSTLGYVTGAVVLALVLALLSPLGDYFIHYRQSSTGTSTLSGRTLLWSAVLPAIYAKPILGHGYLSSTFIALEVNDVGWDAPHLHNAFLEVSYNNGLIGLLLILMINFVIIRNLIRAILRAATTDPVHRLAAGCLALYSVLLINGFFNASFGGRARPPFILLLSLVLVSDKLLKLATPQSPLPQSVPVGRLVGPAVAAH